MSARCLATCPAPLLAGMERCHGHAGHHELDHAAVSREGTVSHWPVNVAVLGAERAAIDGWTVADLALLAEVARLGRPGDVVDAHPAKVAVERGDAPGETALRSVATAETCARAALLHAYREIAALRRLPSPTPSRKS